MFRIRISLNADPDPAFFPNADPDPDPGFFETLDLEKKNFLSSKMFSISSVFLTFNGKNMIFVHMKMPKWLSTLVLLSTFKFEIIKIVKFWVILLSWIRILIRILNADPDPADQNRCGSVRIRIHITAFL